MWRGTGYLPGAIVDCSPSTVDVRQRRRARTMEGLLARLERRLGKFAIPQLMTYVVGAQAIVYVLELLRPGYASFLLLRPELVLRGQVWRLVSYIFLPPASNPLFLIFALMWLWMIGRSLEEVWGAFKLNFYFLLGMIGTTAAAVITGQPMTNVFFEISLFLAFATLFPDYQLYILLLLPLRAKWLGLATAG